MSQSEVEEKGKIVYIKKRFTEEQIAYTLKQTKNEVSVLETCRKKMGVSEAVFYVWKKKYAGMCATELRRMKTLDEENRQLKKLVAALSLNKHMLQDVLSKKD